MIPGTNNKITSRITPVTCDDCGRQAVSMGSPLLSRALWVRGCIMQIMLYCMCTTTYLSQIRRLGTNGKPIRFDDFHKK